MANHTSKILFIKSKSFIFLILSLIVSGILFGYLYTIINNTNYIDKEGVVLSKYKQLEKITFSGNSLINIEQEIVSQYNNLSKITIPVSSYKATLLDLKLKDKLSEKIIRQAKIETQITGNNIELLEWEFEPITQSNDTNYVLQISSIPNETLILYTIEPERHDGGDLYINKIIYKNLRIIIDWEYYSTNSIKKLYSRLAYYKPGIFNNPSTYVVLTILLFILQFYIIWYMLKQFFNVPNEKNKK